MSFPNSVVSDIKLISLKLAMMGVFTLQKLASATDQDFCFPLKIQFISIARHCFHSCLSLFISFHRCGGPSTDNPDYHHLLFKPSNVILLLWKRSQSSPWLMRPAYTVWPLQISPAFSCILLPLTVWAPSVLSKELQFLTTTSLFYGG